MRPRKKEASKAGADTASENHVKFVLYKDELPNKKKGLRGLVNRFSKRSSTPTTSTTTTTGSKKPELTKEDSTGAFPSISVQSLSHRHHEKEDPQTPVAKATSRKKKQRVETPETVVSPAGTPTNIRNNRINHNDDNLSATESNIEDDLSVGDHNGNHEENANNNKVASATSSFPPTIPPTKATKVQKPPPAAFKQVPKPTPPSTKRTSANYHGPVDLDISIMSDAYDGPVDLDVSLALSSSPETSFSKNNAGNNSNDSSNNNISWKQHAGIMQNAEDDDEDARIFPLNNSQPPLDPDDIMWDKACFLLPGLSKAEHSVDQEDAAMDTFQEDDDAAWIVKEQPQVLPDEPHHNNNNNDNKDPESTPSFQKDFSELRRHLMLRKLLVQQRGSEESPSSVKKQEHIDSEPVLSKTLNEEHRSVPTGNSSNNFKDEEEDDYEYDDESELPVPPPPPLPHSNMRNSFLEDDESALPVPPPPRSPPPSPLAESNKADPTIQENDSNVGSTTHDDSKETLEPDVSLEDESGEDDDTSVVSEECWDYLNMSMLSQTDANSIQKGDAASSGTTPVKGKAVGQSLSSLTRKLEKDGRKVALIKTEDASTHASAVTSVVSSSTALKDTHLQLHFGPGAKASDLDETSTSNKSELLSRITVHETTTDQQPETVKSDEKDVAPPNTLSATDSSSNSTKDGDLDEEDTHKASKADETTSKSERETFSQLLPVGVSGIAALDYSIKAQRLKCQDATKDNDLETFGTTFWEPDSSSQFQQSSSSASSSADIGDESSRNDGVSSEAQEETRSEFTPSEFTPSEFTPSEFSMSTPSEISMASQITSRIANLGSTMPRRVSAGTPLNSVSESGSSKHELNRSHVSAASGISRTTAVSRGSTTSAAVSDISNKTLASERSGTSAPLRDRLLKKFSLNTSNLSIMSDQESPTRVSTKGHKRSVSSPGDRADLTRFGETFFVSAFDSPKASRNQESVSVDESYKSEKATDPSYFVNANKQGVSGFIEETLHECSDDSDSEVEAGDKYTPESELVNDGCEESEADCEVQFYNNAGNRSLQSATVSTDVEERSQDTSAASHFSSSYDTSACYSQSTDGDEDQTVGTSSINDKSSSRDEVPEPKETVVHRSVRFGGEDVELSTTERVSFHEEEVELELRDHPPMKTADILSDLLAEEKLQRSKELLGGTTEYLASKSLSSPTRSVKVDDAYRVTNVSNASAESALSIEAPTDTKELSHHFSPVADNTDITEPARTKLTPVQLFVLRKEKTDVDSPSVSKGASLSKDNIRPQPSSPVGGKNRSNSSLRNIIAKFEKKPAGATEENTEASVPSSTSQLRSRFENQDSTKAPACVSPSQSIADVKVKRITKPSTSPKSPSELMPSTAPTAWREALSKAKPRPSPGDIQPAQAALKKPWYSPKTCEPNPPNRNKGNHRKSICETMPGLTNPDRSLGQAKDSTLQSRDFCNRNNLNASEKADDSGTTLKTPEKRWSLTQPSDGSEAAQADSAGSQHRRIETIQPGRDICSGSQSLSKSNDDEPNSQSTPEKTPSSTHSRRGPQFSPKLSPSKQPNDAKPVHITPEKKRSFAKAVDPTQSFETSIHSLEEDIKSGDPLLKAPAASVLPTQVNETLATESCSRSLDTVSKESCNTTRSYIVEPEDTSFFSREEKDNSNDSDPLSTMSLLSNDFCRKEVKAEFVTPEKKPNRPPSQNSVGTSPQTDDKAVSFVSFVSSGSSQKSVSRSRVNEAILLFESTSNVSTSTGTRSANQSTQSVSFNLMESDSEAESFAVSTAVRDDSFQQEPLLMNSSFAARIQDISAIEMRSSENSICESGDVPASAFRRTSSDMSRLSSNNSFYGTTEGSALLNQRFPASRDNASSASTRGQKGNLAKKWERKHSPVIVETVDSDEESLDDSEAALTNMADSEMALPSVAPPCSPVSKAGDSVAAVAPAKSQQQTEKRVTWDVPSDTSTAGDTYSTGTFSTGGDSKMTMDSTLAEFLDMMSETFTGSWKMPALFEDHQWNSFDATRRGRPPMPPRRRHVRRASASDVDEYVAVECTLEADEDCSSSAKEDGSASQNSSMINEGQGEESSKTGDYVTPNKSNGKGGGNQKRSPNGVSDFGY